jgi:hypothetical protein
VIVVDGIRWGTAAEIAAQLGHGVTAAAVRRWSERDGLSRARLVDERGRPQVCYPLHEAALIDMKKRVNGKGRKRNCRPTRHSMFGE